MARLPFNRQLTLLFPLTQLSIFLSTAFTPKPYLAQPPARASARGGGGSLSYGGNDRTGNLPLFPGIFPDQMAPIVRNGADGERELVMARWGCQGRRSLAARRSPTFAMSTARIGAGGSASITAADRAKTAGIRGEAQGEERAVRESERLGRIGRLTRPKSRPGRQYAQIEPRNPPQAATAAVMASTPRMLSARRKL